MKVVLAYSGGLASSVAVAWLTREEQVEVVTLTLDVGQFDDVNEIRARALACGAVRAHVVDARETFARECVLPALQQNAPVDIDTLPYPLIAKTVAEVATIEGADGIASVGTRFDAAIARLEGAPPIFTPSTAVPADADERREYARRRNLSTGTGARRTEQHLLVRPSLDPRHVGHAEARLAITLEDGVPVAINGVTLTLAELIESLSLMAGQHGIGYSETPPTPAAVLLRAVYQSAPAAGATMHLTLGKGSYTVSSADEPATAVTHQ